MTGINATFDNSVPNDVQNTIQGLLNNINRNPTLVRDVDVFVTANLEKPSPPNHSLARNAANYTGTTKVPNDTIFVNQSLITLPTQQLRSNRSCTSLCM